MIIKEVQTGGNLMIFKVLDASYFDEEEIMSSEVKKSDLEDMEVIESGLSSGEIRQSILDRCKAEMRETLSTSLINISLEKFDFSITPEKLEDENEVNGISEDIETLLYELEDEEILNTSWVFTHEIITVTEDE